MNNASAAKKLAKAAVVVSFVIVFSIFAAIYCFGAWKFHDPAFINFVTLRPAVGANEHYARELSGIKKQVLFVTAADGSKLHAWFFKVPHSDKLAIVNHGNAGNISNRFYLASVLTQAQCSVLLYDYRGYGLSTGAPTIPGILQDGLSVYDFAREKLGYPADKILLYGESIGTAVTCHVATNRKCAAVILQSGIGSLPSVGRHLFPILWLYPDVVFAEPHLDNVATVKEIHVPILLCHGKIDRIVPYTESERMFAGANQPKQLVLLPNCGHNDMGVQDTSEFYDAMAKFASNVK